MVVRSRSPAQRAESRWPGCVVADQEVVALAAVVALGAEREFEANAVLRGVT